MNIETVIKLDRYKPRSYQLPLIDAIENKGYKRVLGILPRRAGKDITAYNIMIRAALKKPAVYFYVFPTYNQGRKILWDAVDNDGHRVLKYYLPDELVESWNEQQMRIRLKTGSVIQVIGSDSYDNSLVGTNPQGIIFSEYALQDPNAYAFVRPILAANGGWALFISTPRGKNHLWELYNIAINSPDWFAHKLTINETNHIPLSEIEKDRAEGVMSDDLIQQEYYTSFDMGVEGAYYSKYLDKMRVKGQIGVVPYEPSFKVHTFWDLGMADQTTIIFAQVIGQTVRIIDCYENSKVGLEHYSKVLSQWAQDKDYDYGKHFAPHDIMVRELGTGMSRVEKAKQLGIKFEVRIDKEQIHSAVPNVSLQDGIESVRSLFAKTWIDEKNCGPLLKALENYRQEFDPKRKVYKDYPLHNWASHFADAMRYLALAIPKTRSGLTAEELDRRYQKAMLGPNAGMPAVFRDDLPNW